MGTPNIKQYEMPNRKGKSSKSQAKQPCKCLRCAKTTREVFFGKTLLICGDEACDMRCDVCTERPNTACGFKEIKEEVLV